MPVAPRGPALRHLFIDLELGRDGRFHAMAARRDGEERVWEKVRFDRAHAELVSWMDGDEVIVGHNLHRFDRPALAERISASPLLARPTVDTLELSVLAWPGRPYHRLAKDDQLVRDARPNPLSDVRASEKVLRDALDALKRLSAPEADLLQALLVRVPHAPTERHGWQHLFAALGWVWDPERPLDLAHAWRDRVCQRAPLLRNARADLALVMLAAWLRVADRGDGSVLPAWVRRTWTDLPRRVRHLRATPCGHPECTWCTTNLSPEHWLDAVFGFPGFRAAPSTDDGRSLQRVLVERGLRGEPTFGILPTGGGKSLCFQVPAEARYRLLGQLTVVISPLQSLMKDQVDALANRIPHARAIYSGLPALLRPQVVDAVRSGACGLLYLSPEQFRNRGILRLLAARELGALVFDEAHCLSQWGHDFRTDYPYVLKAIARLTAEQGAPMPPVFLFTATTQHDATAQILDHVAQHTGARPDLFDGGSTRTNLTYQVQQVPESQRLEVLASLLADHLGEGTAIVFCGSRSRTEATAQALTDRGYPAIAYHAGLEADVRRELQDAFLAGQHRIITATNAFGMGVDKPDVRLVVHLDMPSSLEAYLQEAGRGGRDGEPATAVLLWAPGDAESRFALGALGDLSYEDLEALWRAIRLLPARRRSDVEERIVTPRELLFQEALAGRFDPYDANEETRVKAAVNWLEQAGVLERRENHTRVFTGTPKVPTLRQARERVAALDLPPPRRAQWDAVLEALYAAGDDGLSADAIAVLCRAMSFEDPLEGGLRVLSILDQLAEQGLVTRGQTFTAFLSHGIADSSLRRLERWAERERVVVDELLEEGIDGAGLVHLGVIASRLTRGDAACTETDVARLLGTWSTAAQGQSTGAGLIRFQHRRGPTGRLTLEVRPDALGRWLRTRQAIARLALQVLVGRVEGTGKHCLVACDLETLVEAVKADLALRARLQHVGNAVRGAVAWLHDLQVLTVQNGLAVFRSAMQLDRPSGSGLEGDEARQATHALAEHQAQRVLRVHVMEAWAKAMLEDPKEAEQLRADWFDMPVEAFTARWFRGRKRQVARPTTPESYKAIVTDLNDPDQQRIVTRDWRRNHLVVAGPGSGKTRVLVHRVAWLLRCKRVRARQILVVCYTRANAVELRARLDALVGRDARGVQIRTLHAVALGMVGAHRLDAGGDLTLETCLGEAAAMLRGERLEEATEQSRQRDALLRGVNYLFVDEYQDIDGPKYALLSAIAGRAMDGDQRKLRVFAVGDDDQAIFDWDGASTDFIRSFEDDYGASRFVLHRNYRNPRAVLELAQGLVAPLPDRLKAGETLTVDPDRAGDPPMGSFAQTHPDLKGRIPWLRAGSVRSAADHAIRRVAALIDEGVDPQFIGVLARSRAGGLHRLRIAAEARGIPFTWPLPADSALPVGRLREVLSVQAFLEASDDWVGADAIARHLDTLGTGPWAQRLRSWLAPNRGRTLARGHWRHDLYLWARLERAARTLGKGVHLGTMHSAKGLEFDHVVILDEGGLDDSPAHRRLVYVALTRARRSLHIVSPYEPSPVFLALRHPCLDVREAPMLAADAPAEHAYGVIGRGDIWIDRLGQHPPSHPGHRALGQARHGDRFHLVRHGNSVAIEDAQERAVGWLSRRGMETWGPRLERGLRLRLLAVTREHAEDEHREAPYRNYLRVKAWWTGIWEARWRPGNAGRPG